MGREGGREGGEADGGTVALEHLREDVGDAGEDGCLIGCRCDWLHVCVVESVRAGGVASGGVAI